MMDDTERKPLEFDRNGSRILTHGLGGYARGCKCPPCSAAHAEDRDTRRTAAREALGLGRPAADDKVGPPVGVRLSPRGLDLIGQMSGDQPPGGWVRGGGRGGPAADDRVGPPVGVRLSPRVLDLIGQMSGDQPRGAWIRGAVLEKLARDLGVPLEVLDPSPHLAPRRNRGGRNGNKKQQREEGQET